MSDNKYAPDTKMIVVPADLRIEVPVGMPFSEIEEMVKSLTYGDFAIASPEYNTCLKPSITGNLEAGEKVELAKEVVSADLWASENQYEIVDLSDTLEVVDFKHTKDEARIAKVIESSIGDSSIKVFIKESNKEENYLSFSLYNIKTQTHSDDVTWGFEELGLMVAGDEETLNSSLLYVANKLKQPKY